MMMLRSLSRPLERCLGIRFGGDRLMWHAELKLHAFGDYSIAVVQANTNVEDQSQVFASPLVTCIGVFDGHGGPQASRFINEHLFPFINRFVTEQGGLSADVIKKAFKATEEEFLNFVQRSVHQRPQLSSVGSCCLVGAISNNVLYVANLGDSRAVLGKRDADMVVAERLSTDYNVGVEEVRREVQTFHPDDPHIVIFSRGSWRIKGKIQVSRSIGDFYLKNPEFHRETINPITRPFLTSEPSILIRKLNPQDLFLVFASDGLWEQLTDEDAVNIISTNPRAGIAKRLLRAALEEVARKGVVRYTQIKNIRHGRRRRLHDDITVVVVFLDDQQHDSGNTRVRQRTLECTTSPVDIYSFNTGEAVRDQL